MSANGVPQHKWVRMPAVSWNRLLIRASVITFVLYGLFLLIEFFGLINLFDSVLTPWLLVPAGVLVAVTLVSRLGRYLADSAETVEGYTTLTNEHQNLPQLDPRTGRVIRRAGDPYLTKNQLDMALHGVMIPPLREGSGVLDADDDRPNLLLRPQPAIILFQGVLPVLAVTAGGVLIFAIRRNTENHFVDVATFLQPGLVIVPWVLGIYAVVAGTIGLARASRSRALRLQNPTSLVFTFSRSKDLQEGLKRLKNADSIAPIVKTMLVGVADGVGIRLYQSSPPVVISTIAWKDIVSIAAESVQVTRSSEMAAVLVVSAGQGTITLPLASASVSDLPVKSKAETRWVTQQLELLRRQCDTARR